MKKNPTIYVFESGGKYNFMEFGDKSNPYAVVKTPSEREFIAGFNTKNPFDAFLERLNRYVETCKKYECRILISNGIPDKLKEQYPDCKPLDADKMSILKCLCS